MKAIVVKGKNSVAVEEVPQPQQAAPGHLIIKMQAMGINGGDLLSIAGTMPANFFPKSKYDIAGVSGAGTVIATGEGVPDRYKGKKVTVYRSLQFSDDIIGTWSEYVQLHYRHCVILPDTASPIDYAGSLVNNITPYAFLHQAKADGHKGIIATAGNSATGMAMLGICQAYDVPLISLVREEAGKKELEALGAKHVLVQSDADYRQQLQQTIQELQTTAVFDGVGGAVLSNLIDVLLPGSTVYSYGYLGAQTPVTFHAAVLMRGLTIRSFSNFKTATVQDPQLLEQALEDLESMIGKPHFATKAGRTFSLDQIEEAIAFAATGKGKAVLTC